ncbi:hypothetical protein DLM49_16555 [Streptomyces sp. WAC 01438]|nr:hypothetical protein DLM49_16555 [Streptomyces sp. WAC 01438]
MATRYPFFFMQEDHRRFTASTSGACLARWNVSTLIFAARLSSYVPSLRSVSPRQPPSGIRLPLYVASVGGFWPEAPGAPGASEALEEPEAPEAPEAAEAPDARVRSKT